MTFEAAREQMIEAQLLARGIRDPRVLAAMRVVPRHLFVAPSLRSRAYDDAPLPIDEEQTISQPYMVALMSQLLELGVGERVLEVGTGSGYQAAILAEIGATVVSVERIDALAQRAQASLQQFSYGRRIEVRSGDGGNGCPEAAPFDAIVVTAALQEIPRPLIAQLAMGGRLVFPLGEAELQGLSRLRKTANGLHLDYFGECRFVKFIGPYGWEE